MRNIIRAYPTETRLLIVLAVICIFLSFAAPSFFALGNFTAVLNNNAVNVILIGFLIPVLAGFSLAAPQFFTVANFDSMAFQLPELGILTLAMLMPIISGGFNLAVDEAEVMGNGLPFLRNKAKQYRLI